ncbi:MAG TPA: P-type DNA transfer ATPase VirB11 [Noviherbaspirillum sp.]|nr:P-type DNA transfer ATPase VirB11 [Noviherbaspirillum sp.]
MSDVVQREESANDGADKKQALQAFWERAAPLKPFLDNPEVNELIVNYPKKIFLKKGGRTEVVDAPEIDLEFLKALGRRLANLTNKSFGPKDTSLSTHLPTGERVEMTHPPTCPAHTRYLNIRKHVAASFTHDEIVEFGYYRYTKHQYSIHLDDTTRERLHSLLSEQEQELWALAKAKNFPEFIRKAIKYKQNIVVSGATYSGKTTYLRALIELIDRDERIVTVEDTPEMPLPNHPDHNALFYKKNPDDEGATAKEVLHSVMRKSPGRILLAELRGDEAMFYLSDVLAGGHPGGLTTTHSGSTKEAFSRLALLILASPTGQTLDLATILKQLYMTVNVVVQLVLDKEKGRHVPEIYYDPIYRLSLLG